MDDAAVKLVIQWIGLIIATMFFVVSAVKWSRGLAVGMFGVLLFNVAAVAGSYGIDFFVIAMISLVFVGIGVYIFIKDQKRQQSVVDHRRRNACLR